MSLYSKEVRQTLYSYQFPTNLIIDVIAYSDRLALRLYRDNFERFDGTDKEYIAKTVGAAIKAVRDLGCPCYLEVEANVPRIEPE